MCAGASSLWRIPIHKRLVIQDPNALHRFKVAIGDCVRQARKSKGFRQPELAEELGVSDDAISSLENGDFSGFDLVYAAFVYFNIPLEKLFPNRIKTKDEMLQDALALLKDQVAKRDLENVELRRKLEHLI